MDDYAEVPIKCEDKSSVWYYFLKHKDKTHAICKTCWKILKTTRSGTSGMLKHMRNVHKIALEGTQPRRKKEEEIDNDDDDD